MDHLNPATCQFRSSFISAARTGFSLVTFGQFDMVLVNVCLGVELIVILGEAKVRKVRAARKEAEVEVVEAEIEVIDLVLIDLFKLMFEIRIIWKKTQLSNKGLTTCILVIPIV